MKTVFDHPVQGKEASIRLLGIRHGSASVADFAIIGRDETALWGIFLKG